MEPKKLPEYPTEQQMEESWKAYQDNGKAGILSFLKKQREEREKQKPK